MGKYYGYSIDPDELQHINKIGVLCWGLIGDVFMRAPLIEAVKKRFPHAELTAIVDPVGKDALLNHPDCDHVWILSRNKKPFYKYVKDIIRNVILLRHEHFDLFINLYSGGSSPMISRLINGRIRLGFDHTRALRRSNNLLVNTPSFCQPWTKALGEKLRPLGIQDSEISRSSSFFITNAALKVAEKLLPEKKNYVAINLGAGKEVKRWPVERYVGLAKMIHQEFGLQPVVFTNPGMESLVDEFETQHGEGCIKLPLLTLDQIGAVLKRCKVFVTGDTSLMHLGFGVKVPNLVIFTDTRPEIVEPEDCIHIPCFIEDIKNINACGKPSGTVNIPANYAFECFKDLIRDTYSSKSE